MGLLFDHLGSLVNGSAPLTLQNQAIVVSEWVQFSNQDHIALSDDDISESPDTRNISLDSVLDIFGSNSFPSGQEYHFICDIISEPNLEPLLPALYSILSSTRDNDTISGELIEMCGLDHIELVMHILDQRPIVTEELANFLGQTGASVDSSETRSLEKGAQLMSQDSARRRMAQTLRENAARPMFSHSAAAAPEILPHVYTSSSISQGNVLSEVGAKYMLPLGTERQKNDIYEEVTIPPSRPVPQKSNERQILVQELDPLAKGSFLGYTLLNRVQSIVYPTAYLSNENLLICAPTGAGKTDVAMLTVLRVLDQHRIPNFQGQIKDSIKRNEFKIIYVAPMKALASEIVRKLGRRLKWLDIQVRELTGDMQLTKVEIAQTQIIVTTPEKWDVVTRKPTGEGELADSLKLLIIDEVHLLNEERGAVIETIVARTLRQVESSQSVIRIVGLSATLPNYVDVAEFLSVSKQKGLFYFDSSFRPVPLEQHFIGIKGKPGSILSRNNLDKVTYEKVSDLVAQGHQVMVFVHARKETVKSALNLKEMATTEGNIGDFSCEENPQWSSFRRDISQSRNKEMKQLFDSGFGIHHAGMLRSDRNMMERMFEARAIKVLFCTATLAWGINLPAHAVIIKGTQVYDSGKGTFVDLSVLDVLQVFGRAGRPGLETSGEGFICTTEDKLTHYLDAIMTQNPIESQFKGGMLDSLNAEIALGTVANVNDAVRWLGYTYLFVRMRKNPFVYGMPHDELADDPQLGNKRNELVTSAAKRLSDINMILFNRETGSFEITDLGRIAAKYYIKNESIEIFNKRFRPRMSEADVLAMLCESTEFDQIQVRETEVEELEQIMESKEIVPCAVKGGTDTSQGKVNILLQGFISRVTVEDFALVSDTAYAAQNGGRIARALLEIAISRKWANVTTVLFGMSKAIEKRLWPYDQPLKQFDLKRDVFYGLQTWADEWSPSELATQSAADLGALVHLNDKHGLAILNAAKQFPALTIQYSLRPLTSDVLKICIQITRSFVWNNNVHGNAEPFWVWIEDSEGVNILQMAHLVFRSTTKALDVDFVIPVSSGQDAPANVTLRYVSDRWAGAEDESIILFDTLIMPQAPEGHTPLLDLPFLPLSTLRNDLVQSIYLAKVRSFNSVQTQVYWGLFNTPSHALLCAPAGSGKSLLIQMLIWMSTLRSSDALILIIIPQFNVVQEILADLRVGAEIVGVHVEMGERNVFQKPKGRTVRLITAKRLFDVLSNHDPKIPIVGIDLVVLENLERLNSTYELGVSLLRHATQTRPTRFVGVSHSLSDPSGLASWLDVDPFSIFSLRPQDRSQSLSTFVQTFTIPHSASLFKMMAKPAHSAIQSAGLAEQAIVFVASISQCKPVAYDLIKQCALGAVTDHGYLPSDVSENLLELYLSRLQDRSLVDLVSSGIGFYYEKMSKFDRKLMLELYIEGVIRVFIVPRESCWMLPIRASVVVVMGTQYFQYEREGVERQLREYSLTELVHMQSRAVRHSSAGRFYLFCQSEGKDTILRFLNDGIPLESDLLNTDELTMWYRKQKDMRRLNNEQHVVDALTFTYLARRMVSNPTYYDCSGQSWSEDLSRMVDGLIGNAESVKTVSSQSTSREEPTK